jgi:hypothetical protein
MAWGALALCAIVGCNTPRDGQGAAYAATIDRDSVARVRQDSINRAQPGYVVDSILPPAEALRRFQQDMVNPGEFANAESSRDALVARFITAVETNDSLSLIRSAVHRGEFAHLVYPQSPFAQPSSYQPPDVAWFQLSNGSVQGFRRTMARHGGSMMGFRGYRCPNPPERVGDLTIWRGCLLELRVDGVPSATRLFGPIVSRHGEFKFLSLSNDL